MNRILLGIFFGAIAGVLDLIPMVVQKLPCEADLSAFIMWMVVGFFLSTSTLKLRSSIKGIVVAFLVLAPSAIIIGSKEPINLVPIGIMTLVLGTLLGWSMDMIINRKRAVHG